MSDFLFIEFGAVVTEVLGPTRCTVELFCDPARPPTYGPEARIEIDFARSVASVLADREARVPIGVAALQAIYDQIEGYGSVPIGPSWPGGGYEGVVSIRADIVKATPLLAAAVATLPGQLWEHQVVVSIDEATGAVRRYHGFHAELVERAPDGLLLQVANAGASADPESPATTVRYAATDTAAFYAGALVADSLVGGGPAPRKSGAVFISPEAASRGGPSLPKLPPGAGL